MISPIIVKRDGEIQKLERLPRSHGEFDEEYLQELLVKHPELLPVHQLRNDVGKLLPVGREVPLEGCGFIDNLYLSTGGYPVIVETKLWRNPQARREVLSQVLDYTKELIKKDFEWFQNVWKVFLNKRSQNPENLMDKIIQCSDEELFEPVFIDRLHRALRNGDILSLIVGDGIETRLQKLVSHLCEDSAHLRYSLALVELSCFRMNGGASEQAEMLIVPKIIQNVEPVQRAYVRIEMAPELEGKLQIKSMVSDEEPSVRGYVRNNLNEDDFLTALDDSVGVEIREKVERFYGDLIADLELEPDFKSATLMLKVPDPTGEKPGVSVLAIERQGRIYNSKHMPGQLERRGFSKDTVNIITSDYWGSLHQIDNRFLVDGIAHNSPKQFLPITEVVDKLNEIDNEVRRVVERIRRDEGIQI
jgi:hypothetical protein